MSPLARLERIVALGQDKIGAYDKQLWEQSVEEQVLKSIQQVPKKNARVKAELIDVDLVRGSTFSKAKPQHGWLAVSRMGLLRLLLLPIFFRWWESQTTRSFTLCITILYVIQVGATVIYITDSGDVISNETLSLAHLTSPWILMMVLGLMHAQIVATRLSHKHHHRPKLKGRSASGHKKKKRPRFKTSERESASQETETDKHLDESCSSRERRSNKMSASKRSNRLKLGPRRKARSSDSSPGKDMFDKGKFVPRMGALSHGLERSTYNRGGTTCSNGMVRHINGQNKSPQKDNFSKSMLNDNNDDASCSRKKQSTKINNMKGEDIVKEFRNGKGLEYKGMDSDDNVMCASEDLKSNLAIEDFTGELLLPDEKTQGIKLRDDLIIPCDCATNPESNKDSTNNTPSRHKREPASQNLPQVASTKTHKSHDRFNGVNGTSNMDTDQVKSHSTRMAPRVLCAEDGIMVDWAYSNHTEDRSPQDDFSISSTGSDSLLFDSKKAKPASGLMRLAKAEKGVFIPPQIVRTDDEGTNTNEEADSEAAFSGEKPDTVLRRRHRPGGSGSEVKHEMKHKTKGDQLSVNVVHRKESSCESEADTGPNTPISLRTSEYEWEDTVASECSSSSTTCSSEDDDPDSSDREDNSEDPFHTSHPHNTYSVLNNLASSSDKVSCMIWEEDQVKKVDLTVLDIGWTIIQRVDKIPQMCDDVVLGVLFALAFTLMPIVFRSYNTQIDWSCIMSAKQLQQLYSAIFGNHWRIQIVIINGAIQRFSLALIFFFLLSVADRTFKQRLLYAKNFCYLTSSRRAKKYELPHFRLNKVRNIKTWLSLRSYLKKRGPQRSIDTIVSAAFILAVVFVSLMCLKLLQDSGGFLDHLGNWELVGWCMALAIYLLRFMTIGTKINRKYRNFSVLITEQINLYLHMEQKPHKKDELMLANSVLKLAEDLLKELESPFKISGLSANPFLYNVTKVIVLSAFSAVLTELLGFKLKLYKIKLRP